MIEVALPLLLSLGLVLAATAGEAHGQPTPRPSVEDLREALDRTALDAFGSMAAEGPAPYVTAPAYETFLRMDASDVPDSMLLAILLAGSTRRSPVDVALDLLQRVGGDVTQLSRADVFRSVRGVGDSGHARMLAATELARRISYRQVAMEQQQITSPEAAVRVLRTISTGPHERLSALYLDRRNRILGSRLITVGNDAFTIVDPRQVFRPALELGAASVILAHQHPSGDATPSSQDRDVTQRVQRAGEVLGVRLLDHFVIGGMGQWESLAERGEVPAWGQSHAPVLSRDVSR